jgi:DNA-3-methyladenine glycosylase I
MQRCSWAGTDPLYIDYHDREWGVPLHDERTLFEMLILDGAQAGLSWITILKKRDHYRAAFDNFDARKMARYGERKVRALLVNPGIVRNLLKVEAAIHNAGMLLKLQEREGSLDDYLWRYVDGKPVINARRSIKEIPARTPLSDTISKDLSRRGFKFVGPTICYAFMQAVGMVNDHTVDCFRYRELGGKRRRSAASPHQKRKPNLAV